MRKHIANIITACRIFGSGLLLCLPVSATAFYITYLLCGVSDMIDGTIARKTNSCSNFGSKLDTAADLALLLSAAVKFLPVLRLPVWVWIWICVIAVIKISSLIWGCVLHKQFVSRHTVLNKASGLLLFLFPLTLPYVKPDYSAIVICSFATLAALQEGRSVATGQNK